MTVSPLIIDPSISRHKRRLHKRHHACCLPFTRVWRAWLQPANFPSKIAILFNRRRPYEPFETMKHEPGNVSEHPCYWLTWSLLSALFAAASAILTKLGAEGIDANLEAAIRISVLIVFTWPSRQRNEGDSPTPFT